MNELKAYRLWLDIKLGIGLLALLGIVFLAAFIFVFGMVDPSFALGAAEVLAIIIDSCLIVIAFVLAAIGLVSSIEWLIEVIPPINFKVPGISSVKSFFRDVDHGAAIRRSIKDLNRQIAYRKEHPEPEDY